MTEKQKIQWHKYKNEKGTVFFKKHPSRKHGIQFDRYYRGEYQFKGKRVAINFGWVSETKWSGSDCTKKLNGYKKNAKEGKEPISLKNERELNEKQQEENNHIQIEHEKSEITVNNYFYQIYYPRIQKEKKAKTYKREESLFRVWIDKKLGHLPFKKVTKGM